MKASNESQLQYEGDLFYLLLGSLHWIIDQGYYSLTMFNKGIIMVYRDLQDLYYLIAIDLSSNKLCGETPHVMGELTGLVLLNLFNNMLSGSIPSSLGNPSNLEALDLSLNSLSGKIPQQLAELIFLSLLRISHQSPFVPPSASDDDDQDSGFFGEFDWKVAVIGYGGELLAGVALGSTFSHEIFAWLKRRIREVVKAKKARPMRARPKKATWQLRNGGKRIKSFEELVQQAKSTDMKKFQFKLEILKNSPSEFNSPNEQGQLRK
ncbi:hypothetical protein JHK84_048198 [Glycine max]|nr:hypothetical protein JHK85_048792 [Glycine max]KAG5103229.1 hypothetical protein JHK84_048198 [Glycine max]